MAIFDDTRVLLSHLRHSFITSDDTGTSEAVMLTEDLDKEINNEKLSHLRASRLTRKLQHSSVPIFGTSLDISTSPKLSGRPGDRSTAFNLVSTNQNGVNVTEKRCRKVVWKDLPPSQVDMSVFQREEVTKSKKDTPIPSPLTILLQQEELMRANPYYSYSRHNGESHQGAVATNTFNIFFAIGEVDMDPIKVCILNSATVADLVGLAFWKYNEGRTTPVQFKKLSRYNVRIAEDDGEIDTDLPELRAEEKIGKFGFTSLGIVERNIPSSPSLDQKNVTTQTIVKVFFDQGGHSTIPVRDSKTKMQDIYERVIKKRQFHTGPSTVFQLERKDIPGMVIDLTQPLEAQETDEFLLTRIQSGGKSASFDELGGSPSSSVFSRNSSFHSSVRAELTSHQFKSFAVTQVHKIRSNVPVQMAISGKWIEVNPVAGVSKSLKFLKRNQPKRSSYSMEQICGCELVEERLQKTLFKLVRKGKDGVFKSTVFEATLKDAKEIVSKISLILETQGGEARREYEEMGHRRPSKSSVTSQ